jgi:hypothetical protein
MEAIVLHQTRVSAWMDGLTQIVQLLCVLKRVAMGGIVPLQIIVLAQWIGLALTVGHLFVNKSV